MRRTAMFTSSLVIVLLLSFSVATVGAEEVSLEEVIKVLEEAEKTIESGDSQKGIESLKIAISMLNSRVAELGGTDATSELRAELSALRSEMENLKAGSGTPVSSGLKVGYVNVAEAFTVFTDAVQTERESVTSIKDQLLELRSKAMRGEINAEEYNQKNDILQAERLRAQFEIELAMIEEMMDSKGFESVQDRLRELKEQVRPSVDQIEKTLLDMRENSAIPEEVSQILTQANSQYEQLDSLLSNLIQSKIVQATNQKAKELGYDLVLREQNVVLARNQESIDNLTEPTKQTLREELNS
ncbi:hypothetical protein KGY64_02220 [Candidatus Bipolaricaulota bacterium]|nr:hypothetical protein [Candidatus Bipolaricaulota bacterium]